VPGPAGLVLGLSGSGLGGADMWGRLWWELMISNNSPLEFVLVNSIRYSSSYLSVVDVFI
jgi:hypothetical protein